MYHETVVFHCVSIGFAFSVREVLDNRQLIENPFNLSNDNLLYLAWILKYFKIGKYDVLVKSHILMAK
jgi:hypothetical protein